MNSIIQASVSVHVKELALKLPKLHIVLQPDETIHRVISLTSYLG